MNKKKQSDSENEVISIADAAKRNRVTRQAIYVAIKNNKLPASKENSRWKINLRDLEEYNSGKYSRQKSRKNGELIFDKNRGFYSVNEVAKMLKVPAQKIYYAVRENHLESTRQGAAWVIHIDDITKYLHNYLSKEGSKQASN